MSAAAVAEAVEQERNHQAPGHAPLMDLPSWISPGLMTRTQEVWSRHLQRPVSAEEALDMLINVKRLAEFIIDGQHLAAPQEDCA